jgi:hypothetical protein
MAEKVTETLLPKLSELAGFGGYYLIEGGDGVMTSISLFESPAEADESTRLVSEWVRAQGLEAALPNAPTITRRATTAMGRVPRGPSPANERWSYLRHGKWHGEVVRSESRGAEMSANEKIRDEGSTDQEAQKKLTTSVGTPLVKQEKPSRRKLFGRRREAEAR